MATPREIKQRVVSVKNTQKITRAMEMVASVKMRKARNAIFSARPYAEKLTEIAMHLRASVAGSMSPFLVERPEKKIGIIVVGSDKGLCGGFNSNVVRKTLTTIREKNGVEVVLTLLGKKVVDNFKHRKCTVSDRYPDIFFLPRYADAMTVAQKALEGFLDGTLDAVYVVYNEFKSAGVQKTVLERFLPVPAPDATLKKIDYLFEPDPEKTFDQLLPKYFKFQIWRVFLESYASEQGARMAAMSSATKNAGELIDKLTLFYNKARQAAITKELLEVVSGAEALK
jgi:F-type H+-transporting ATPase subunit gamma